MPRTHQALLSNWTKIASKCSVDALVTHPTAMTARTQGSSVLASARLAIPAITRFAAAGAPAIWPVLSKRMRWPPPTTLCSPFSTLSAPNADFL